MLCAHIYTYISACIINLLILFSSRKYLYNTLHFIFSNSTNSLNYISIVYQVCLNISGSQIKNNFFLHQHSLKFS